MITIIELEEKTKFFEVYRRLALKYWDQNNCPWQKPKKPDVLSIFHKYGYPVKYASLDKNYIESHNIGKYKFEYYYEFNGMSPWIFIYIKRDNGDWPVERSAPGLKLVENKYPSSMNNLESGYAFYMKNLDDLDNFFSEMKPALDKLRKEVCFYLEKDELDFNVF